MDGKSVGRSKDFRPRRPRWGRAAREGPGEGRRPGADTGTMGNDAVASLKLLQGFFAETGRGVSAAGLRSRPLRGRCGGWATRPLELPLMAISQRWYRSSAKDLAQAVEEWIAGRKSKTGPKASVTPGAFLGLRLQLQPLHSESPAYSAYSWANKHPTTSMTKRSPRLQDPDKPGYRSHKLL